MKLAMLRCWKEGVFSVTVLPRLTVHDELDFSDPGGVDYAYEEMARIMETAILISVPVKVECDIGTNWGNCGK
jgi:DNA polymerase I-like protein with 3'-5' exonuclease and polymerase domains